jgi:5-formyltetrahydrofolate cyclo-ligase
MSQADPATESERRHLRARLRQERRALAPAVRIAAAQSLAARLLELPFAPTQGYVAGYWAMDGEIALHAWQLALPDTVTYCLPVLHADGRLRFAPWRSGQALSANRYGIPEPDTAADALLAPESMQFVVAPLVGFDAHGNRLGMGAGWYDRSFANRRETPAPPWLVGAAFAQQQVQALTTAPWDVALDAICTDTTTHLSNGAATA